jgi:hypothetical protein
MLSTIMKKVNIYIQPLISIWFVTLLTGIICIKVQRPDWAVAAGIIMLVISKLSLLIQIYFWVREDLWNQQH